jgi:hypothetical protein
MSGRAAGQRASAWTMPLRGREIHLRLAWVTARGDAGRVDLGSGCPAVTRVL